MPDVAGARALRASLVLGFAFFVAGCSDADSPRCAADRTLAQACAERGCPQDLQAALTAGEACDSRFPELWQADDLRAVGVATGFGGAVYHFDGNQLVGVEFWTDMLGDCPTSYVNGRRTVNVHAELGGADAAPPKVCVLCPDWAVDDQRPLCP
jgi:hypothetical protein